jgi:hypothetical protein
MILSYEFNQNIQLTTSVDAIVYYSADEQMSSEQRCQMK